MIILPLHTQMLDVWCSYVLPIPSRPHPKALESKKRAALLAVSPICALIPAAVLVLVAVP